MKLTTVIIDDNPEIQLLLSNLLGEYFPEIEIKGTASSLNNAVELIRNENPDIVFMDIELEDGTGFQVLQKLKPYSFKLIFITAFNDFAIKAFKFSAMDYILKPVNEFEFRQSVENVIKGLAIRQNDAQYTTLMNLYEKKTQSKKIILKTAESIFLVDISEILYCRSDNTYTTFFLSSGKKILVSRGIKEYDEMLSSYRFFRPHQSYLVNLNHVKRLDKADGGFLIMNDDHEIPVSTRRKKLLIQFLEKI
jgi:two-component system LytT family response regulator